MDHFNGLSDGSKMSVIADGLAGRGRQAGAERGVAGFEYGGSDRRAANGIVHAPDGSARNHINSAAELHKAAKN